MAWMIASIAAASAWILLLLTPWRAWSTREQLSPNEDDLTATSPEQQYCFEQLTVLVPARNEAEGLGRTLAAIRAQSSRVRIIVIDDESTDDTAKIARAAGAMVIQGSSPPSGWTGKLWALEQGRQYVTTHWVLQLDADIELAPGMLQALFRQQRSCGRRRGYDLVSIMALLPVDGFWQRFLLPAYVWFFKLIYPFRLSNSQRPWVAAAAGGCILIRRQILQRIGGYGALRYAVIDDCTLARCCKNAGGTTWIGLSREVVSHRASESLTDLADLVARTAFTQLRHSIALLLLVSALLILTFWLPVWNVLWPTSPLTIRALGAAALMAAMGAYIPLLRFYRLSLVDALALPLVASLYLWMTWLSAWRHWRGVGAQWKGRSYQDQLMKKENTSAVSDEPKSGGTQHSDNRWLNLHAEPGPVFIIGSPRSGTSVLHWSLLEHPELWGSEESEFMIPMAKALREGYEHGVRFGEHAWLLQQKVGFEEYCAYMGLGVERLYRDRSGGLAWVEQTPAYSLITEELALMFPKARFLFIHRDGRKVNESMRRMWQWSVGDAAKAWVQHNECCLNLEHAYPERVQRIAYERMVAEPEAVFREICNFLKLPFEPKMTRYFDEQAPINVSPGTEQESGQDKLTVRDNEWTDDDRDCYWGTAGDMMNTLSYRR